MRWDNPGMRGSGGGDARSGLLRCAASQLLKLWPSIPLCPSVSVSLWPSVSLSLWASGPLALWSSVSVCVRVFACLSLRTSLCARAVLCIFGVIGIPRPCDS
jgi:hypothetical protein